MTRRLAVLRPEPGNTATAERAAAAGFTTLSLPLFAIRPMAWTVPDVAAHDALIVTSANALRFAGAGLAAITALPVVAIGPHTAEAATAAGFDVIAVGGGDAAEIAQTAAARGFVRALHLTGRDRMLCAGGAIAAVVPVYESVALSIAPTALRALAGTIALLHSARAARRLDALLVDPVIDRSDIALATFSRAIANAAGQGWAGVASAVSPTDQALFAAARALSETTND